MSSSATISLFSSEKPLSNQRPTSFLISILAHGVVIGVVSTGFMLRPRIIEPPLRERYALRHLDLHMPMPQNTPNSDESKLYPNPKPTPQPAPHAPQPELSEAARPAVARQVAQAMPTHQTLLQPKLPRRVLVEKTPVPTVVLWSADTNMAKIIVPPRPQKIVSAQVQPSVNAPNEEANLADIGISSADIATKQPVLASTTSPVVVLAKDPTQAPAQTTSNSTAQPTPASIVSLSDLRAEGTVVLPPANQSASGNSSGLLAPGSPEDLAKPDANGTGQGTAVANNKPSSARDSGNPNSNGSGAATNSTNSLPASGNFTSAARFALPKDGQFGVVVVGTSLDELYPEAAELWSGRLAYTVYLHVGLKKSWILQYALPADAEVAAGGNAAHVAAPWPYTIVRPNIAPGGINADALMIHGFINKAGRFVSLVVAFPAQFQQADFVLSSLEQWEFRPAAQAGQPTAVEVLLIIPDEEDE
ncbi:MAG: hypothetical protein WBE76_21185 [Terracidiphilus sp.]